MPQRVLDVGNCGPDHGAIRRLVESRFDARVDQAHQADDALKALERQPYALVLVNRQLDCDYSDGIEVIRQIKARPELADVPVMLVTNYAEHQAAAQQIGAVAGFGKSALASDETVERLRTYLRPAGVST
jgi:CheY-like chemotaxis protein